MSKFIGLGEISASAVMAKIADLRRFQNEKKIK
jgi:transposase